MIFITNVTGAIKERYIDQDLSLGVKGLIQDKREGFPEEVMIMSFDFKEVSGKDGT